MTTSGEPLESIAICCECCVCCVFVVIVQLRLLRVGRVLLFAVEWNSTVPVVHRVPAVAAQELAQIAAVDPVSTATGAVEVARVESSRVDLPTDPLRGHADDLGHLMGAVPVAFSHLER